MTPAHYAIARIAKFFGIDRRNKRLSDAGGELHLLREAETFLGHAVWEHASDIESLSMEYWKLRQLAERSTELQQQLVAREAEIKSSSELQQIDPSDVDALLKLHERRAILQEEVQKLAHQRDLIVNQARLARRNYEGMKAKLDVLSKNTRQHAADIKATEELIQAYLARFATLKEQRVAVGHAIERLDLQMQHVENDIAGIQRKQEAATVTAFQAMGGVNREISALRAEHGNVHLQMQALYTEIGRMVSRHTDRKSPDHAAIMRAIRHHRALIEVMRALRQSIAYNHRLANH